MTMLNNLMHKELRLNVPAGLWLCLAFPILLLVPTWPFVIAFGYVFIPVMVIMQMDKANADLLFATLLPVRKRDIVTARTATLALIEAGFVAVGAVFAVVRHFLYDSPNQAGMNVNLAFFGVVLAMYAVFNAILLPGYYKSAYLMLWPILGGSLVSVLVGGVLALLPPLVPALGVVNDRGLGNVGWQLTVLAGGLAVYAAATALAHRQAVSNFERVDL
jgi:hypothetical protein